MEQQKEGHLALFLFAADDCLLRNHSRGSRFCRAQRGGRCCAICVTVGAEAQLDDGARVGNQFSLPAVV